MPKEIGVTIKQGSEESSKSLQELLVSTYEGRDFNRFHYYGIDSEGDFSTNTNTMKLTDFVGNETTGFTLRGFTIEHWAERVANKFKEGKLDYLVVFDELGLPEEEQRHVYIEEIDGYGMLEDTFAEQAIKAL